MHFPLKLYQIVQAGPCEVISWADNGKSFIIFDADVFCNKILPKHFRHNKLTSFQRQLNLYGFQRIAKGTEAGRYYHALFDKNRPDRLSTIKRESRSAMNNNGEEQGSDEEGESPTQTEPTPVTSSASGGGRAGTRSSRTKKVVAGPEDHTAALAMINISRSLSSECLENEAKSEWSSPRESPRAQSPPIVKHEFEHVLQQSLDRQSALEQEVVQLKLLVNTMMSKMDNMTNVKIDCNQDQEETFSIEPLTASSASSDEDEDEKRPCESDDDFPAAKRMKSSLPLSTTMSAFGVVESAAVPQFASPPGGAEQ